MIAWTRSAFPDWSAKITHTVVEGDYLGVRWEATGIHKGTYEGIEPKNLPFKIPGMSLYRFKDGKIAEAWTMPNRALLLEQINPTAASE